MNIGKLIIAIFDAFRKKRIIQIYMPDKEIQEYDNYNYYKLRKEIIRGDIRRDYKAHIKGGKTSDWSTIEKVSGTAFALHVLYRPIWAHTQEFLLDGAALGTAVLATINGWTLFHLNSDVGFFWSLYCISILITRWYPKAFFMALGVLLFQHLVFPGNYRLGTFITFSVIGVLFFGILYGAPIGMIIGTIIGHFRKKNIPRAVDAIPEGRKPYLIGLLAPAVFLGVFLPLHLIWLLPKVSDWLSRNPNY